MNVTSFALAEPTRADKELHGSASSAERGVLVFGEHRLSLQREMAALQEQEDADVVEEARITELIKQIVASKRSAAT